MLIAHQNDARQFSGYRAVQLWEHARSLKRAAAYWHGEALRVRDADAALAAHFITTGQACLCVLQAARDRLADADVQAELALFLPYAIAAGNASADAA